MPDIHYDFLDVPSLRDDLKSVVFFVYGFDMTRWESIYGIWGKAHIYDHMNHMCIYI